VTVFNIETEQETDGRWLAEVVELPGVMAYGAGHDEAVAKAQALALRVVADRLEHDEAHGTSSASPSTLLSS
jgi:predicted RNase H-like HicB family nuclease